MPTQTKVNLLSNKLKEVFALKTEVDEDIDFHDKSTVAHSSLFNGKANVTHNHTKSEITDLTTVTSISGSGDDDTVPTTKAIVDYINSLDASNTSFPIEEA